MNRFSHASIVALAITFITIAFSMIMYIVAPLNDWSNYISYLFYGGILFWGLTQWRSKQGGYISYGQAMAHASFIMLIYTILISIWTYVFMTFIAPDLIDQILLKMELDMEKKGVSEEQMAMIMESSKTFMTPGMMILFAFLVNLFFLTIINLILCAFVYKNKPVQINNGFQPQMPPQDFKNTPEN